MNIKIALLDNDKQYSLKFINAFGEFYPQVEIYSFSDIEKAISSMQMRPVDVVLISESVYNISKDRLKDVFCKAVIVMVGSKGISQIDDYTALCKYQRVDHLDQAIMKIYSEKSNIVISDNSNAGLTRVVTFMSGAGGNGCSTAAAAYAAYLAGKKQNVLYLDLHTFGMPELFFDDSGNYTMTDCISAVISQKSNLGTQLKSFVRHDQTGVYYYQSCVNSLDWFDASEENIQTMIKSIIDSCEYNCVVIDAKSDWDATTAFLSEQSGTLFIVSDGTTLSNRKAQRVWDTAATYYKSQHKDISKMYMLYTCFSGGSKKIKEETVRDFVTLPYSQDHHSAGELVRNLSARQYWE